MVESKLTVRPQTLHDSSPKQPCVPLVIEWGVMQRAFRMVLGLVSVKFDHKLLDPCRFRQGGERKPGGVRRSTSDIETSHDSHRKMQELALKRALQVRAESCAGI